MKTQKYFLYNFNFKLKKHFMIYNYKQIGFREISLSPIQIREQAHIFLDTLYIRGRSLGQFVDILRVINFHKIKFKKK